MTEINHRGTAAHREITSSSDLAEAAQAVDHQIVKTVGSVWEPEVDQHTAPVSVCQDVTHLIAQTLRSRARVPHLEDRGSIQKARAW